MDNTRSPDHFKPLHAVTDADPRSAFFSRLEPQGIRPSTLEDQHAEVARLALPASVPEAVTVQFETARNLFLYAWFVYRFYPVAEHQALTTLELGLRTRFPEPLPKKYGVKPNQKPTLHPLLRFAIETGVLKNEGFRCWHEHVHRQACQRYQRARRLEMVEHGLDQIELDYSQATPNHEDRDYDYLAVLTETLHRIRNSHAHGGSQLHSQVLGTLELVAEILCQLYPDVPCQSESNL